MGNQPSGILIDVTYLVQKQRFISIGEWIELQSAQIFVRIASIHFGNLLFSKLFDLLLLLIDVCFK